MKKLALFLTMMMLFCVMESLAAASIIDVVSVTASSTFVRNGVAWGNVDHLIDDSGLSGSPLKHAEAATDNSWMTADHVLTGWLVFDLGSVYTVDSTDIWQYSHWNVFKRGVNDFDIYSSINGTDYTFVSSNVLQKAKRSDSNYAQLFSIETDARYIKFKIISNWGDGTATGLSEVRFNGSTVPIPGAVWLLGSGLFGLVAVRRKRNNIS